MTPDAPNTIAPHQSAGVDDTPASPASSPRSLRSARIRAWEHRQLDAGGMRSPATIIPPDVAAALRALQARGYAATASGVIHRAITEAALRMAEANGRRK